MSSVLCQRCGSPNIAQAANCVRCGTRLSANTLASPELSIDVETLELRLAEITIACDKYRHEELTNEEFYNYLIVYGRSLTRPKSQNIMINDDTDEEEAAQGEDVEVDPNFQHFVDGLTVITPILEDGDLDRLERGLQVMREGNLKLLGLTYEDNGPDALESGLADVMCVVCSTQNSGSQANCKSCGAKLPKMVSEGQSLTHKPVTSRLDQFKKATGDVLAGKQTVAEFAEWLEKIQETLRSCREGYLAACKEYSELSEGDDPVEEVDLCTSGMDDFEAGMEELWNYVDSEDASHAHSGLELIERGNNKINEARAKNRERRNEMADEFGYV